MNKNSLINNAIVNNNIYFKYIFIVALLFLLVILFFILKTEKSNTFHQEHFHQKEIPYKISAPLESQADLNSINTNSGNIHVAYMPPASEYNFYRTIGLGIKNYAHELNLDYNMLTPEIDNPKYQLKLLENVVYNRKVDVIIISTHNPTLVASAIKSAVDSGIVVILINSDVPDFITNIHAIVGYNQRKGTQKIGAYLDEVSKGEKMNVGILEGSPGYHSNERVGGFLDGISSNEKLNVVSSLDGKWNTMGGFYATLEMLKRYPDIDAIFAANDYEIIGAIAAAKLLGKNEIIFLGNDGDIAALQKISAGELDATVNTDPYNMGQIALQVSLDILNGKFSGGFVETPTEITHQENIDSYYNTANRIDITNLCNDTIIVLAEEYKNHSEERQQTLHFNILKEIYSKYDIELTLCKVPFARGVLNVQNKSRNYILLGGFPGAIENVYYSQWHYDIDTVSVLFKKDKLKWENENSLHKRSIGIMRDYNLYEYLFADAHINEISKRDNAINLLLLDRIELFLDIKSETIRTLDQLGIDLETEDLEIKDLFYVRQYLCFTNNATGQALADIFDSEFPNLIIDGRLKDLYDNWQITYPFN